MDRVHKRPGDSMALPFPCDKLADRLHSVKLSMPICFCGMCGSPGGEVASIFFFPSLIVGIYEKRYLNFIKR